MFNTEDIERIKARGSSISDVEQQIRSFQTGFPFLDLVNAATVGNGIKKLSEEDVLQCISEFELKVSAGIKLLKFVPASGAASRMFKDLYHTLEKSSEGKIQEDQLNKGTKQFLSRLSDFAFYTDLKAVASNNGRDIKNIHTNEVLRLLLDETGLNYGSLPKGLLKFHSYPEGSRTPLEEHCVEGASYCRSSNGKVHIHFTVSPEHQQAFEKHVAAVCPGYEKVLDVHYDIVFSCQKPSTDTIAVTPENEPFREEDGSLLFRPGGHGALLENLNDLDADIIFIKNIDNVVPDRLKEATISYKKALAGILLKTQEKIFHYQKILNERHYYSLESAFFAEAANFLENVLHVKPPNDQYYTEKEVLYHYLRSKFNRPIRVCGMVKNEGEPGGGPFWAENRDGSVSLQIVESSQIDLKNDQQASLVKNATHFNPVDLVCGVKNYKGEKYNLSEFRDPDTGFISTKSKSGKTLKALELPGLWNGAMADWNTLFVEVPVETFNPVKTVNDLLRKEHQLK